MSYRRTIRRIEEVLEDMTSDQQRRWPALVDRLCTDLAAARIDEACSRYDYLRDCRKDRITP